MRFLESHIINQIAAGEVIEDSSSVVKELIENALDSGADFIEIETIGGGQGSIIIRDNGSGMTEKDLEMSVQRHATSKISSFDDLYSLSTLGFRGEALASIAAISETTIYSSSDDSGYGYILRITGGKIDKTERYPRTGGTTVEVSSLFYNVPVRRRFQKTELSDRNKLRKLIESMVLSRTKVEWRWISEGREELFVEREMDFDNRIRYFMGESFFSSGIHLSASRGALKLVGRIGNPAFHKSNRLGQKWFVNGRCVECSFLSYQINEVYKAFIPIHRYPAFILHLTLPEGWYDVNIHPQKRDIRIRRESLVGSFIYDEVSNALVSLSGSCSAPEVFTSHIRENDFVKTDQFVVERSDRLNAIEFMRHDVLISQRMDEGDGPDPVGSRYTALNERKEFIYVEKDTKDGQEKLPFMVDVFCIAGIGKFLLAGENDRIYLVDRIKAIRHIIFVAQTTTMNRKTLGRGQFLVETIFPDFSYEDVNLLREHCDLFESFGFVFEFEQNTKIRLMAVPEGLNQSEAVAFLRTHLEYISLDLYLKYKDYCVSRRSRYGGFVSLPGTDAELLKHLWSIGKPETAFDGQRIMKRLSEEDLLEVFIYGKTDSSSSTS
ncbi:MAG: DNA mismatch repair endonuclease MutL [Victivallaceae bacterium]